MTIQMSWKIVVILGLWGCAHHAPQEGQAKVDEPAERPSEELATEEPTPERTIPRDGGTAPELDSDRVSKLDDPGVGGVETRRVAPTTGRGGSLARNKRRSSTVSRAAPTTPAAPALKAGRHDDNAQYNRWLSFLATHRSSAPYSVDVSERVVIRALDSEGKSLPNCSIGVQAVGGKELFRGTTFADGRTQFFPAAEAKPDQSDFTIDARCGDERRQGQLSRTGKREVEVRFRQPRKIPRRVAVDIAIVLDTTGSMQSQIDRLKKTLKAIHFQLSSLETSPDIRFALVAYRDRGDAYLTQVSKFTDDLAFFQRTVDGLDADGGGDTPEDLQSGLREAMKTLRWRPDAVRIGFVVADAVPHTDYGQNYTYLSAMEESLQRGIKWVSVGAGGLPVQGEVIFRQLAQFTMGEYVFVTAGHAGDTGGSRTEASHHVGTNYSTENLDQAMVRIVRRELSYLTDAPKDFDTTIVATANRVLPRDSVLAPAVAEAMRQLQDYSAMRIEPGTPLAVVPVVTDDDERFGDLAEYVTDQCVLVASRSPAFKVVDRDLEALRQELKLQLSEMVAVEESVRVGRLVGAELLVVTKLSIDDNGADLFARLVRVETGEILSVAKVSLDRNVISST